LKAEILVLDSHSTDGTVRIAQDLGATVHKIDWKGYGATKNEGARLAKNDWILSLDADETVNEALQNALLDEEKFDKELTGFWLRRSLVFLGKTLIFGAVKNEFRLRLYNKNYLKWDLKAVHESLVPKQKGALSYGELQGCLLHYSYRDENDMVERLDKYARLSTDELSSKSRLYLQFKKTFAPTFSFIKNYFFKKGFADGRQGKIFAKAQAAYVKKKYDYALLEK
jgi:glycosyltransferase involved in cell wall biosynthesis